MLVQRSYAPTEEAAGPGRLHGMLDTGMEDLRVPWKADSFLPMGARGFEAPTFLGLRIKGCWASEPHP